MGVANNPLLRRGVLADSSAVFVEKTLSFASRMGRNPASPQRARQLLGLSMDDHGQQETAAGVTIDSNGEETE